MLYVEGIAVLQGTVPLTDYLRMVLIQHSLAVHFGDKDQLKIKADGVEGLIRFTGKVQTFGSYYGYEFTAEFDTDRSLMSGSVSGKVRFINTILKVADKKKSASDLPN
jgi:hypothetical protein